ncbi:MAG: glycosyltransferase family 2 protein [Acidimicrobiales bacterium]
MGLAPRLSVVIVNWNAGGSLLACVSSILSQPDASGYEVIVVDNASSDGSAQTVAAVPGVRVIANAENRGLAAANNQGIVAAQGEVLLVSNPDVVYRPGAIAALVAALGRHPSAAIVVPRLRYPDGTLQTSAGDIPTLRDAVRGRRHSRRAASTTGFWWDGWAHDEERAIGRGHEAAYVVRRAAVDDVGLQDESFFLDWEGIDWTERMRSRGWQIWFTPTAEVVHEGGASIRQVPLRWIVRSHRGMYRYFAKRHRAYAPALAALFGARAVVKLASAVTSDVYGRGHRGA